MDTVEMPRALIRPAPATRPHAATRPRRKPPVALRATAGLLGALALVSNAALMMSDRAPAVLRALGGDLVVRLSARIDADTRVTDALSDGLPASDVIVHVGVWSVAVVLAGIAVWSWRGLLLTAVSLFTLSVFVEAAQGVYTDTRAVEVDDVLANGVGVLGGTLFVGLLYLVWGALSLLLATARRD